MAAKDKLPSSTLTSKTKTTESGKEQTHSYTQFQLPEKNKNRECQGADGPFKLSAEVSGNNTKRTSRSKNDAVVAVATQLNDDKNEENNDTAEIQDSGVVAKEEDVNEVRTWNGIRRSQVVTRKERNEKNTSGSGGLETTNTYTKNRLTVKE